MQIFTESWPQIEDEKVSDTYFSNISMTPDKIRPILVSDNMDRIKQVFREHHDKVLEAMFTDKSVFTIITDSRNLLSILVQTVQNANFISVSEVQKLNDLVYGFFSKPELRTDKDKWEAHKNYYLQISKAINKTYMTKLMRTIPENLSALLCAARFSSDKDITQAKRVNNVLIKQDPEFLTEQRIVDIYIALYDHITPLFVGVMCDYRNPNKMSDSESENWSAIDLALLDIVENITYTDIRKVVESLHDLIKISSIKKLKFNLYSINSADYGRTCSAIEEVFSRKS